MHKHNSKRPDIHQRRMNAGQAPDHNWCRLSIGTRRNGESASIRACHFHPSSVCSLPNPTSRNGPGSLLIDGREVPVRYRSNAQARRIIMRMEKNGQGIVLTVPPGTSAQAAHQFALTQAAWIWQRLVPEDHEQIVRDAGWTQHYHQRYRACN